MKMKSKMLQNIIYHIKIHLICEKGKPNELKEKKKTHTRCLQSSGDYLPLVQIKLLTVY